MKFHIILHICLLLLVSTITHAQSIEYYNGVPIEKGKIIFKYKESKLKNTAVVTATQKMQFQNFLKAIEATEPEVKYPTASLPSDTCKKCVNLLLVHDFTFNTNKLPTEQVLSYMRGLDFIQYAEPNYIESLLGMPNDTETPSQWYISEIQLDKAWDVTIGDTSVVVAIVDAGYDIVHTDLVNQIKYNYDDPINGIDDEGDGYIDNFRGWDVAENDNNPSGTSKTDHGNYVAGMSSAQVNNSFAVSGSGYSCKFLPIKIATESGLLTKSYEGVVYAANNNVDIINCSWGSQMSYSQANLDVINYATYNKNCLIIAAAGNANNTGIYYPASYHPVISVAGTSYNGEKWTPQNSTSSEGSNWNYYVDICAPACTYKSVAKNNSTTFMYGGTSFASPIVSGIAGLVKSQYPDYDAIKLGEKLRTTADDIYTNSYNTPYMHLLGSGRVNAHKAVTATAKPSIRLTEFTPSNVSGQYMFYTGDTLVVAVNLKNYMSSAINMFVIMNCETSIIAPISTSFLIPTLNEDQDTLLHFKFRITNTLPADFKAVFKMQYSAVGYYGFEYFPLYFNPSYYSFSVGNYQATVTSNGTIGVYSPYVNASQGVRYKTNSNMFYDAGLLLALDTLKTVAGIRNNYDYTINTFPTYISVDSVSSLYESTFTAPKLGLYIMQYTYVKPAVDALIHEYRLLNTADTTIHNLYGGPFFDWTIGSQFYNRAQYVDSLKMMYVSTIDPTGYHVGVLPLHYHTSSAYALNVDKDSITIAPTLTTNEIFRMLSAQQSTAGYDTLGGVNVASTSASMISKIEAGETAIMRFAIVSADDFPSLIQKVRDLRSSYEIDTATHTSIPKIMQFQNYEVLYANKVVTVKKLNPQKSVTIGLYDIHGKLIKKRTYTDHSGFAEMPASHLPAGTYSITVEQNNTTESHKILIH